MSYCRLQEARVRRFADALGLEVKTYHDYTPVDFCDEYTVQLRRHNGESLLFYPGGKDYLIPEKVTATSEICQLIAYNVLLSKIIGNHLVLFKDDNCNVKIFDGVFAESVEEFDLKLSALGY